MKDKWDLQRVLSVISVNNKKAKLNLYYDVLRLDLYGGLDPGPKDLDPGQRDLDPGPRLFLSLFYSKYFPPTTTYLIEKSLGIFFMIFFPMKRPKRQRCVNLSLNMFFPPGQPPKAHFKALWKHGALKFFFTITPKRDS